MVADRLKWTMKNDKTIYMLFAPCHTCHVLLHMGYKTATKRRQPWWLHTISQKTMKQHNGAMQKLHLQCALKFLHCCDLRYKYQTKNNLFSCTHSFTRIKDTGVTEALASEQSVANTHPLEVMNFCFYIMRPAIKELHQKRWVKLLALVPWEKTKVPTTSEPTKKPQTQITGSGRVSQFGRREHTSNQMVKVSIYANLHGTRLTSVTTKRLT